MNGGMPNQAQQSSSLGGLRWAWLILVLVVKLMLITAMQNHNISEFIYQGF